MTHSREERCKKNHASECAQLEVRERLPRCLMGSPGSRSGAEPAAEEVRPSHSPCAPWPPRSGSCCCCLLMPSSLTRFGSQSVNLWWSASAPARHRMPPQPDDRSIDTCHLLDEYIDTSNLDRYKSLYRLCFICSSRVTHVSNSFIMECVS